MNGKEQIKALRQATERLELKSEERHRVENLLTAAEQGDAAAHIQLVSFLERRGYRPMEGEDVPLPPGPLYVCPVDPQHYAVYQTDIGQELVCPEHERPLVRAEEK